MLIDVSSVVWGGLLSGKDTEFGFQVTTDEGKTVWVNTHEHGVDRAVGFLRERLNQFGMVPKQMIFVVEGDQSKLLRTNISDTYKANRSGTRVPEQYQEFTKTRDRLVQQFLDLGARSCTQPAVEADDVIAYLALALPSSVIISTDGDLQQCISDKAHLCYDGELDKNRYGPFPTRYTTLYKALVGDTSDNIKGAKGFGHKAFLDLYVNFSGDEGLDAMIEHIEQHKLEELHENVADLKALQRVIDDREGVYLSWQLALQYPDKVNTWRAPLRWQAGMVKPATKDTHPTLRGWAAQKKIVHAGNYDNTLTWARTILPNVEYVALDIETSAPEESDEWLELKKRRATAEEKENRDLGVDVFGHALTGQGVTFGDNDQYSLYFTVDHVEEEVRNVTPAAVLEFVKLIPQTTPILVHNSAFELTVLEREWGDAWRDNGWHGFLPNIFDTKLLATYVDENSKNGLKDLSEKELRYKQTSYSEVTQGRKMNQMKAGEVLDYGTDDTVCTAAIFNHYRCLVELEGTWDVFLQVEQDPAYLTALAFNQGTPISLEKLLELEREDKAAFDKGWAVLRDFLIANGWAGSVCPQATSVTDLTPAFIKQAYLIVTGDELATQVRTPSKLIAMIEACEQPGTDLLAIQLKEALEGRGVDGINQMLKYHFKGEPEFNLDSVPQVSRLMYEVMKLPVRIRNKVTDAQRAEGQREGNAKTNDIAMAWALQNDVKLDTPVCEALKALQAMKVSNTRRKMFYEPYRVVQHWKDGLVHASVTQNGAGTRRYTSSGPNLQQLPKHPKATGEPARFREVFIPHHSKAVIVSLDFKGQELVIITDYSKDPGLMSCYVGDDLKDMHALTATGILKKKALANRIGQLWTLAGHTGTPADAGPDAAVMFQCLVEEWKAIDYATFAALDSSEWKVLYKVLRAAGKKTNFTTEYGAQAPKLAETLLIEEDEAQQYIDARLAAFPRAEAWKQEVAAEYRKLGYQTTMLGARRHLGEALKSGNKWEIGKAERQAVNFKVQGSAAEMTKLAMGRIWRSGLCFRYDCRFIAPIHDELVFSVAICDLIPFLREVHALMTQNYAAMTVPIVSSISIGPNFGEQIEVGEAVNDAVIHDTVSKIFPMREAA